MKSVISCYNNSSFSIMDEIYNRTIHLPPDIRDLISLQNPSFATDIHEGVVEYSESGVSFVTTGSATMD